MQRVHSCIDEQVQLTYQRYPRAKENSLTCGNHRARKPNYAVWYP